MNRHPQGGGMVNFVRNIIVKFMSKVQIIHDTIVVLKIDKYYTGLEKDVFLICVYTVYTRNSTFMFNITVICFSSWKNAWLGIRQVM